MYVCARGQRVRWECNVSLVYVRAYMLVCVLFGVGACVCMYVCMCVCAVRESGGNVMCP